MAGCIGPIVPVPPPQPESFTFSVGCPPENPTCTPDETVTTFRAAPDGDWINSWVVLRCEATGDGVVTRTNPVGGVDETEPFACRVGDRVLVGYEHDEGQTYEFCLILENGPSSSSLKCP